MECQSSSATQMPAPRWGPRCFLVMQLCCSSPTLGALGIFCPFTPPHPLAPFQIPWLLTISSAPQVYLFRLFFLSTLMSSSWISESFSAESSLDSHLWHSHLSSSYRMQYWFYTQSESVGKFMWWERRVVLIFTFYLQNNILYTLDPIFNSQGGFINMRAWFLMVLLHYYILPLYCITIPNFPNS